jgi:hypothetical protein
MEKDQGVPAFMRGPRSISLRSTEPALRAVSSPDGVTITDAEKRLLRSPCRHRADARWRRPTPANGVGVATL